MAYCCCIAKRGPGKNEFEHRTMSVIQSHGRFAARCAALSLMDLVLAGLGIVICFFCVCNDHREAIVCSPEPTGGHDQASA